MAEASAGPLLTTPLHAEHVALGARMVPFAGYDMPVQYPTGIIAEHSHTRNAAGLFDVSHMGQALLVAESRRVRRGSPGNAAAGRHPQSRSRQAALFAIPQ
ncbi:Aminomethyltransferase [Labrys miyagiensis]